MPLVGSFAGASARAYGLGAGGVAVVGYNSIATVTVGTAVTSVTFTSIPATYTHLQLRYIVRTPTNSDNMVMQFNSDTATTYSTHFLVGSGTSVISSGGVNFDFMYLDAVKASGTVYTAGIVDILDYANTNKYKTIKTLSGSDLNGSGYVWQGSGNWRNTNPITSIQLRTGGTRDISQYSSFALYGVTA